LTLGRPIFIGQNEHEQLFYFMEYLGIPPEYIIRSCKKNKKFFDINLQPIKLKNISRIPNSKKLEEFIENADNDFIDLVKVYLTLWKKCFVWDPFDRITAEDALFHPWIYNKNKPEIKQKEAIKLKKITVKVWSAKS